MIEVKVSNNQKINISNNKEGLLVNDQPFDGNIQKIDERTYRVYKGNRIFHIEVAERKGKEMKLKVDGLLLDISVTDHIDQILDKLGMNTAASNVVKDIKAPMPGSILNIIVNEGAEVRQGDQLLVLEAMKMENVIKSPGDGMVSKIHVAEKENVEKNQVLISFE